MANVKITELTAVTNPVSTDVLPIVDVSADTTKKVTIADLLENAGNGSASAPAFAFDADSDTGMYRDDTNKLAFATAATGRLFIDANGNVGVGTGSPNSALDITAGGSDLHPAIELTNSAGTGSIIRSKRALSLEADYPNNSPGTTSFIAFSTDGSEKMRLTHAGRLGIGTSDPAQKVEISGSNSRLRITDSDTAAASSTSYVEFYGSDARSAVIYTDSNGFNFQADSDGPNVLRFLTSGTNERARIDSEGALSIFNGTAPTASATNGVKLYAEDVSSSSELKVRDEAGNVTTLSPHNFDLIPEGPSEDMAWSYYSERDGKRINVDMLKAVRLLEQLSGEQLVFTS